MKIGDKIITKTSGECTIVEFLDGQALKVVFSDGYEKLTTKSAVKSGSLKNPYHPSVQGVGFLGEGIHRTSNKKILTPESILWRSVLQRCYSDKFIAKHPTYKECSVDPQWHNFQEFAEWCQWQVGFKEGWSLDKDILVKGNKIYSPEFCVFVPPAINNLVISNKVNRGSFPIGVSWNQSRKKFTVSCHIRGQGQKEIGVFMTADAAFDCYKTFKENLIKDVAKEWQGLVDDRVYHALNRWKIDKDD